MPSYLKNPELHRYVAGGTLGGPIIKDKLFGFVAYQHLHVSDQYLGNSFLDVPIGLDGHQPQRRRGWPSVVNNSFPDASIRGDNLMASDIDPTALALFNIPAVAGRAGHVADPERYGIECAVVAAQLQRDHSGRGALQGGYGRRQPGLERNVQGHAWR